MPFLSIAIPVPLRRSFDYLPPDTLSAEETKALTAGIRVSVPFAGRKLTGVLLAVKDESKVPASQLKTVTAILDHEAVLSPELLALGQWAANYYQHPIGDVLANTLPILLRKGESLIKQTETHWRLSTEGKGLPIDALKRAKKQAELLKLIQQQGSVGPADLNRHAISRQTAKALLDKQLLETFDAEPPAAADSDQSARENPLTLNSEQQLAVDTINGHQGYGSFLLEGITGSGKTEVYLQLIAGCLQRGQQALVLIPEIGLTPQTLSRFQRRFNCPIALLNSALTDRERLLSWQSARSGEAGIVIGTRSAIFTQLPNLGLIIIDEEHDSSFKQQDGFRYSARDIGIKRAFEQNCPILLGSATPSLETLNNALQGRYQHLQLRQRATGAAAPEFQLLDVRHAPMEEGFSHVLLNAIEEQLKLGNQILVFINRRGFSPLLMCHDCGYRAQCHDCDATLTVHYQQRLLRCHHCESQRQLPRVCPDCKSSQLDFRGTGTERSERALKQYFPHTPVIRIDRDTTSRKTAMQDLLEDINRGEPGILVGTQMLAKGHHFADVTLVAVLDADGGLFSADFRGAEKMGQLLVQVAGRAGRESKPGKVIIQTHNPDSPLMISLVTNSYNQFARERLAERQQQGLPPYGHLAILRAEADNLEQPEQFLRDLRQAVPPVAGATLYGPLPAPMTRRAGRFRAQLLLQSSQRAALHHCLQQLAVQGEQHPMGRRIRWSIDVDPTEVF